MFDLLDLSNLVTAIRTSGFTTLRSRIICNQGSHYGTLRKRENFVCFKALRNRKCFHNAAPEFVSAWVAA